MADALLIAVLVLLIGVIALLLVLLGRTSQTDASVLAPRLDAYEKAQERTERAVREEVARSRDELGRAAREQRQELVGAFATFGDAVTQRMLEVDSAQKAQLDAFSAQLAAFATDSGVRLDGIRTESANSARQLREEVIAALNGIADSTSNTMRNLAGVQQTRLDSMSAAIDKLGDANKESLESVRATVETKLQSIQTDNASQLDQIRQTVDEKLQGTLEKRLGESFKQVSERLEQVHRGLGEMQTLATGVGDLKKVLTNVKTRGTWGEVQLGALLEQVLTTDQYSTNVATKGGGERVEYAIKLPGQNADADETVWLPIDAKFPVEDYQRLIDAQDRGDIDGVEAAGKQLEARVKASASDICNKYVSPPNTTDFGVMFLPIEGLFAEVIRRPGLTEAIQRDCRVVIPGPTTLWSILNSLQMGFRTLAIQKRSSEVWTLLAAVKTEWMKYGDVLEVVQKRLTQASDTIEKAKVRSRAVGRRLRDVQELPAAEATAFLPIDASDGEPDSDEDGERDRDTSDSLVLTR